MRQKVTHERNAVPDRRRVRMLLASVAATAVAVPTLGSALTSHAAITVEPEQTWETGTITKVDDGDTVFVDVRMAAQPAVIAPAVGQSMCADRVDPVTGAMPTDQQGAVLHDCRVRIIGIQTAETKGTQGSTLGQCSANQAEAALAAVLPIGTPVQLRSIRVTSAERQYQGGRVARSVYYEPTPGSGVWVDAARAVVQAGLAMWMPLSVNDAEKPEYTHNLEYRQLVDAAAAAGLGIFSGHLCAPTGQLNPSLRMYVVSDPPGDDAGREYVILRNNSDVPADLGGWTLRDSSFTYARFPLGTTIAAHDYLRIYGGSGTPGTPTAHDFYFNGVGAMFANYAADSGYFTGDGVYLYAPDTSGSPAPLEYGDLRAWYHYPCTGANCNDPLVGKLVFSTVMYDPPGSDTAAGEYVEITNPTTASIALGGYQFRRQNTALQFDPDAAVAAGGTLRISMGVGVDTPTLIHMGRTSSLLTNTGDLLFLENVNSAAVDCRAWGDMACPPGVPMSGTIPIPTPTPSASPSSPSPTPVATTVARATTKSTVKIAKPSAPQGVTATASKRRIRVHWTAPASPGTYAVTKYRARAYLKSGSRLKWKATCYAKAEKYTCQTKKLKRGKTYYVKVWARNKKGYGTASQLVAIRNK